VAFSLFFDQSEHIQLFEVLVVLELLDDLVALVIGIRVATRAHQKNGGLNVRAQLNEGLVKVLFGVHAFKVDSRLKVWHKLLGVLIVLTNSLRKDSRSLVRGVRLLETDHALLAKILGALQRKHARRGHAILDKELGLELTLREVLKKYAGHLFS